MSILQIPSNGITLRPYQEDAVVTLTKKLFPVNSGEVSTGILSLPTGAGKTITAAAWLYTIKDDVWGIYWACHREELKTQALNTLKLFFQEEEIGIWDASRKDPPRKINVIMTPSTRSLESSMITKPTTKPNVLVFDEAHHMNAATWKGLRQKIFTSNSGICVGLTATPTDVLDKIVLFRKTFKDLVSIGYLAKPNYITVNTNLTYKMTVRGGDFDSSSLNQLDSKQRNEIIFDIWNKNRTTYGKCLFFCSSLSSGESLLKHFHKNLNPTEFNKNPIFYVNGSQPIKHRNEVVKKFKDSTNGIMINISVFTEGFDDPSINSIFLCRPTTSEILYHQMVGRGSRMTPTKKEFYIVDFVDAIERYEIARNEFSKDILGEYLDPELADRTAQDQFEKEQKKSVNKNKLKAQLDKKKLNARQVVGWISWSNRYKTDKKYILVERDVSIVASLYHHLRASYSNGLDLASIIDKSYGDVGHSTIYDLKEWKNICWSIIMSVKTYNGPTGPAGMFKINFFLDKSKPAKNSTPSYDSLAKNLKTSNDKLNKLWKDKSNVIFDQIIDKIHSEVSQRIASFIKKNVNVLSYQDRIFTFDIPDTFLRGIAYSNIGINPGMNTLAMWKKLIKHYLKEVVHDSAADVCARSRK
jgi:superfamily II DNA or RNA helicase